MTNPYLGTNDAAAAFLKTTGLLAEINRLVLHPRGLALAVAAVDGEVVGFKGLVDARHEAEGLIFHEADLAESAKALAAAEAEGLCPVRPERGTHLGYWIQPRKGGPDEPTDVLAFLRSRGLPIDDFDPQAQTVTLAGVRYSVGVFEALGAAPIDTWVRIVNREGDKLTIDTKPPDEALVEARAQIANRDATIRTMHEESIAAVKEAAAERDAARRPLEAALRDITAVERERDAANRRANAAETLNANLRVDIASLRAENDVLTTAGSKHVDEIERLKAALEVERAGRAAAARGYVDDVERERAELKRLRLALARYADHHETCGSRRIIGGREGPCSCGFAEALGEATT